MVLVVAITFLAVGGVIGHMTKRYWTGFAVGAILAPVMGSGQDLIFAAFFLMLLGAGGWVGAALWWKSTRNSRFGALASLVFVLGQTMYEAATSNHNIAGAIIGGAILIALALVGVGWIWVQERAVRDQPPRADDDQTGAPVA